MDWGTIGAIVAALATVTTIILNLGKIAAMLAKAWATVYRGTHGVSLPGRTLIIQRRPQTNSLWWHMGNTGKGGPQPALPMMQVCADVNVTNILPAAVTLAGAVLRYRPWWSIASRTELGDAHVFNGNLMIGPNDMQWIRAHFMFKPPWRESGQVLVADLGIFDQYNNCHWMKGVRFPYH